MTIQAGTISIAWWLNMRSFEQSEPLRSKLRSTINLTMQQDMLDKVVEKLAITDRTTIVHERAPEEKFP